MKDDTKDHIESYNFRYTLFTVNARFEGEQLLIKSGFKISVVPVDRIEHLYAPKLRRAEHMELVVAYRTKKNKLKRARAFANVGEPGFDGLVEALRARCPGTDLSDLPASEAYARMGSREVAWVALPLVMAVGWLLLALAFSPMIMHAFDGGAAEMTPNTLAADGAPDTRNLTLTGRLLVDDAVFGTEGADKTLDTLSAWVPIVGANWRPGDTVHVVVEFKGLRGDALAQLGEQTTFDGVLRDLLWEGIGYKQAVALKAADVHLSDDMMLFQYGASARDDRILAGTLLGSLALLIVVVSFVLRRPRPEARRA